MTGTYTNWQQAGASLRWDRDESARSLNVQLGPLGTSVIVGRRERAADVEPDERNVSWTATIRGRQVCLYLLRRHLGGIVEWCRLADGPAVRVELGPVGMAIEPVLIPSP